MENGLPKGWEVNELDKVCEKVSQVKPEEKPEEVFTYIDIASIDNTQNKITSPKSLLGKYAPSRARQLVKAGDTVFSTVRTYLKNIAFVEESHDHSIASTGFCVIRPKIDKKYVFYYTQTKQFLEPLNEIQRGTSYPAVRDGDVFAQKIPLPPLPEQHRIVAKLDAVLAKVDSARARMERLPGILQRFRQSVLAQAVSGKLTEGWRKENESKKRKEVKINEKEAITDTADSYQFYELDVSWQWVRIMDIGEVKGGKRLPKGDQLVSYDTGFLYLKAGNLKGGTVIEEAIEYLLPKTQKSIQNYTVNAGDAYITIVGACIGDAGVIPTKFDGANLTENACKICNLQYVESDYLSTWLRSSFCQKNIQQTILSGAQGKLALGRIKMLPIPLPPLPEQKEIVRRVQALFAVADRLEARYEALREKVEGLPQALLAKAFRGELVGKEQA